VNLQRPKSLQRKIASLLLNGGMSTLIDSARSAVFRDGQMFITLRSGSEIHFPVNENPRLAKGTQAQLNHVEFSPYGIHWPELDEDLSFEGLLRGDYGQGKNQAPGVKK
jgi:hypothetical protein